jgi:DNA-binding NarL/FixJ family response regulator
MAAMDVLLVDDQPGRASSLRILTSRAFGDVRMRTACSLSAGLQQAREAETLDLVVLDLDVSGCSGVEALLCFRRELPEQRVLVISVDEDCRRAQAALEAGAVGYLPGRVSLLATAAAIRLIGEGGTFIPGVESARIAGNEGAKPLGLAPHEIDLLRLFARGLNTQDIAHELEIAESAVQERLDETMRALGASSRVEALVIAARRGLPLD